jgi:hypothetical protein
MEAPAARRTCGTLFFLKRNVPPLLHTGIFWATVLFILAQGPASNYYHSAESHLIYPTNNTRHIFHLISWNVTHLDKLKHALLLQTFYEKHWLS